MCNVFYFTILDHSFFSLPLLSSLIIVIIFVGYIMSNKTISINPSLFSVGSKTKRNRGEKKKPAKIPIISPNVLKNKLLKRIKEHKQKENTLNFKESLKQSVKPETTKEKQEFQDEFHDSIEYLQSLSKASKQQDLDKKRKEDLERKTLKNHSSYSPIVNLDLPMELEPVETIVPSNPEPITLHAPNDVPYGILKGGTKPTYRQWTRTQRSNIVNDPNLSVIVNPQFQSRENRLKMLKNKIQQQHTESSAILADKKTTFAPTPVTLPLPIPAPIPVATVPIATAPIATAPIAMPASVAQSKVQVPPNKVVVGTKYITKKTIKRKYSLGRSNIKRKVSVLIKDRGTRKKIITAQKELKKKNINEVKDYLKKHNLWAVGSNAPNDVLRQMYESAMLAGEITNQNTDILLHNLSKEDQKL